MAKNYGKTIVVVTHNQNIAKMQTWSFVLKKAKL
mgnify:CR=1 FL=1